MKILLSAINSRHTHQAISLAYIAAYWNRIAGRPEPDIREFDLNQTNETIYSEIILEKPDILAFSAYIWSLERVLTVASAVKAAFPGIKIILGGPEASFIDQEILNDNPHIDFIIRGEGEKTFESLILALLNGDQNYEEIHGIAFRCGNGVLVNEDRELIKNLDEIPSPFQAGYFGKGHGFTYYEASRGCPSRCSYCLSSVQGPVRNHSLERVKSDLDWFFDSGFRQIRFADRTFNFDFRRAAAIIEYIIAGNRHGINFHFEFQADFLDDRVFNLLKSAPAGMFHLEIGVQSTNPKALTAVNRRFNLKSMFENIEKLRTQTGCHLHLDLLGGLPEDGFNDFLTSLDQVYHLKPHSIQISLVKVLRGTPLRVSVEKKEISCMQKPPYTVLASRWLFPGQAIAIQEIGKLVEGLYNCDRFNDSISFIVKNLYQESASSFFSALRDFWRQKQHPFFNFGPESIRQKLDSFLDGVNADPMAITAARVLLEHEFHLSQKVPAGGSTGPAIETGKNKNPLRVTPGIKAFWYKLPPKDILLEKAPFKPGEFPVIYRFEKDLSAVPDTRVIDLALAESFVLAMVQNKIPLADFSRIWNKCGFSVPEPVDFSPAIENLKVLGLLYDPSEKNYQQVKQLIDQTGNHDYQE
ncbi:MAG: DUF4080 domain-containing protein [Candidatus Rifleibacteriota bacterium]